jgi:exopolysaccharide/PEP-CTERM locus tyrosine autokinase
MSLIEQAAKRLAQLRNAGVEFPDERAPAPDPRRPAMALPPEPASSPVAPRPAETFQRPPQSSGAYRDAKQSQHVSRKVDIDSMVLRAKHIITPDQPKSRISEEYRLIKRPLIANAMGRGAAPVERGNLIMVTSALPREGKSYTAVNLAISIAAELDKTVLLVDADVARPSVLNVLELPPAAGLLDLLPGGTLDLPEVLLRTNIEKLTLLPSGMPRKGATELLASDAMGHLVHEMADRYPDRIIIFDSPPLLLTSESRVLATHMGQIVLVVQADSTSQAEVRQALATIESCPVKMVVLNQVRAHEGSYGYQHGYGYGYGNA